MSTLPVNGIQISYDDFGKGDVPLIFIHGFPFDKSTWQPQVEFFKNIHRVIAYDIRGFGGSTKDARPFSMNLFADDLIALMDALKIEKCILCGLSMGGYIALNVMSRYPGRIAKLVLADTQCVADTEEGKQKRFNTIEHIKSNGLADFAQAFVKNLFLNQQHPQVGQIKNLMLSIEADTITRTLKAMAERSETCSILGSINVPTLILCGKEDVVTPTDKSEFIHSRIKNSTLKIIDNAAHLSNLEQPKEFNDALHQFLS